MHAAARSTSFQSADSQKPALLRVDAREHRDAIVALFERAGNRDVPERFEWYYRSLGQPSPISWIVKAPGGQISGICSVSIRSIRFDNELLKVGVAGNLLVDRQNGTSYVAFSLIQAIKTLVRSGELDILLGIPNPTSEPLFVAMGFTVIDRWSTRAMLFQSKTLLERKLGFAGVIGSPFVDLYVAARRAARGTRGESASLCHLERVNEDELGSLDTSRWQSCSDELESDPCAEYVKWRFLHDPLSRCCVLRACGKDGTACAYIVVRSTPGRTWLVDCSLDKARVTMPELLLALCNWPEVRKNGLWVAHLRSSKLSAALRDGGFVPVPSRFGGYPDLPLIGFWQPQHRLANTFRTAARWNLFTGFNDI